MAALSFGGLPLDFQVGAHVGDTTGSFALPLEDALSWNPAPDSPGECL